MKPYLRHSILLASLLFLSDAALAQTGVEKGKALYGRYCSYCHGMEGAGDGPAARYLNPPPRDFTLGLYKWKSTPFDEYAPSDADLGRMISGMRSREGMPGWDGMNGTSMPGWSDVLGKDEVADVAAYLKSLAGYEKAEKPPVDLSGKIRQDEASISRGRLLFKDRCTECHGEAGRGDATKKLKDDWGARTWPRDLTEGWTFRAGSTPEDIYTRITAGIPGTQMPSFADPASSKVMTVAERWDVANYAASLNAPERKPEVNSVLKAVKVPEALPDDPSDALWQKAPVASFFLFPQIFTAEKAFTPSVNSVSARTLYNSDGVAFLLEWDDPTNSMPWEPKAVEIAGGELFADGAAVQFPSGDMKPGERPYFGMGGPKPVVIWHWKSAETEAAPQTIRGLEARGFRNITPAEENRLSANAVYDKGRWRLVIKAPLKSPGKAPSFEEGAFTPVAFAIWDGSNGDAKSRHLMTGWQWMRLEKEGEGPSWFWPAALAIIVLAAELLWLTVARKR